jgi:hypothetical protein
LFRKVTAADMRIAVGAKIGRTFSREMEPGWVGGGTVVGGALTSTVGVYGRIERISGKRASTEMLASIYFRQSKLVVKSELQNISNSFKALLKV